MDALNMEIKGKGLRRGAWTEEEDLKLRRCMEKYGAMKWCDVPSKAGLNRCRKSCRLRWLNYLSPSIKRGRFEEDEDDLIIRLHKLLGNSSVKNYLAEKDTAHTCRWSLIAGRLPGRTANDIKNYWNTHLSKRSITKETPKKSSGNDFRLIRPRPQTIPSNWIWSKESVAHPGHLQEMPEPPPASDNNGRKVESAVIGVAFDNGFLDLEALTGGDLQTDFGDYGVGGTTDDQLFLQGDEGWADFLLDMDF